MIKGTKQHWHPTFLLSCPSMKSKWWNTLTERNSLCWEKNKIKTRRRRLCYDTRREAAARLLTLEDINLIKILKQERIKTMFHRTDVCVLYVLSFQVCKLCSPCPWVKLKRKSLKWASNTRALHVPSFSTQSFICERQEPFELLVLVFHRRDIKVDEAHEKMACYFCLFCPPMWKKTKKNEKECQVRSWAIFPDAFLFEVI